MLFGKWASRLVLFQFVAEHLGELIHLRANHGLAVTLVAMLVEIIVVVGFGRIEFCEFRDLGYDWSLKDLRFVEFLLEVFCLLLLRFIVIEHHRPILRADIGALAIQRRGVMRFPKHFQ